MAPRLRAHRTCNLSTRGSLRARWLSLRGGRFGLPDKCAKPRNLWIVIRPWSITFYNSPSRVLCQPVAQLPTSNMAEAVMRDGEVENKHVELRTLDMSFFRFAKCPPGSHVTENGDPIAEDDISIETWGHQMRLAAQRIENLVDYDQGVKEINRIVRDESELGPMTGVWQVCSASGLQRLLKLVHGDACGGVVPPHVTLLHGGHSMCGAVSVTRRFSILQTQKGFSMRMKISELQIEQNVVMDVAICHRGDPLMVQGNAFFGKLGFLVRTYRQGESLVVHRSHSSDHRVFDVLEVFSLKPSGMPKKASLESTNGSQEYLEVKYFYTDKAQREKGAEPMLVAEMICQLHDPDVLRLSDDKYCTFHGNRLDAMKDVVGTTSHFKEPPPDVADVENLHLSPAGVRAIVDNSYKTLSHGIRGVDQRAITPPSSQNRTRIEYVNMQDSLPGSVLVPPVPLEMERRPAQMQPKGLYGAVSAGSHLPAI
ncbi:hypothetical protein CYMTET_45858 [Cymbomonas tetramitiformis]|uniref:Uncharacterized protein n=1 Tax=Cymbomonas tetramitiformis TaxID=36881 RepID=A0AAE0BZ46_9CHLO|nr:hypothetical protein CYMTET_45858 [Cymbomonas tetramitiformis]